LSTMKNLFHNPLYVQIGINRMVVRNITTATSVTLVPEVPYSHARMLIGNFNSAEALLKKGVKEVAKAGLFAVSPQVLVHPIELIDGGLSQIEERVFRELALGSGARSFVLWTGNPLTDQEVINKLEKP
jgi:rod shape-determining protein MreB